MESEASKGPMADVGSEPVAFLVPKNSFSTTLCYIWLMEEWIWQMDSALSLQKLCPEAGWAYYLSRLCMPLNLMFLNSCLHYAEKSNVQKKGVTVYHISSQCQIQSIYPLQCWAELIELMHLTLFVVNAETQ